MRVNNDLTFSSLVSETQRQEKVTGYKNFGEIFQSTLNLLDEANELNSYAEELQVAYVTGETDDLIALNMAQSRASFAVQFAAQVTSKITNAYREIMNISV